MSAEVQVSRGRALLHPKRIRAIARHRRELAESRRNLRRIDDRSIPNRPGEIRLFTKARNEAIRLPFFLQHYRELGVDRFFIVDNGSIDGFVELALEAPDVHVFQTSEPLHRHNYWGELLLQSFGRGHWCVAADLDEVLVLPSNDDLGLHDFRSFLESEGSTALDAVLLDMYPRHGVEAFGYQPGDDPLEYCNYFDPDFEQEPWAGLNPRRQRRFRTIRYGGGCRKRVFDVDVNLTKVPFFFCSKDTWLSSGAHHIYGVQMSELRAVMLHFKYLHDFGERTIDGAKRGVYQDGGGYYSAIANAIEQELVSDLYFAESIRLENMAQLEDLGFLVGSPRLACYRSP